MAKEDFLPMASAQGRSSTRFFLPQLALGALVIFLGTKTNSIDHRGTGQVIHISLPKLSLAVAAIQDTFQTWNSEESQTFGLKTSPNLSKSIRLAAGQSFLSLMSARSHERAQENVKVAPLARQVPLPVLPVRLAGLVIRQPPPIQREIDSDKNSESLMVAQLGRTEVKVPSFREKIISEFAAEDLRQPTNADRMKLAVEKELKARALEDPNQKRIGSVYVAAPANGLLAASPTQLSGANTFTSQHGTAAPQRGPLTFSPGESAAQYNASFASAQLGGSLVLTGGLALTDSSERILVYREFDGMALERGEVIESEGRFVISPKRLSGRLVAQLRNRKGQVLGQGELNLARFQNVQGSQQIENLKIELHPAVLGAKVGVSSIHSTAERNQLIESARVVMVGEQKPMLSDFQHQWFSESGLAPGSSFIAEASAANHWGTMLVGVAGQEVHAKLFPNAFVEALLNITLGENRKLAQNSGVIWGRVVKQGKELTGAKIEMAGDHRVEPIYFNSLLIPDRFAESTGENGAFAMVWVTPGIQSLRVTYQGQAYPASIVPVSVGRISYVELEIGEVESAPVKIYDAFDSGKDIQALVRLAGDETSEIDVQGQGHLGLPKGNGIMMLEVDAGSLFELSRYTIGRDQRQLRLPMVRHDWIQSLVARRRINLGGDVGVVVGFVANDSFTVSLEAAENSDRDVEVVYFDSMGRPLYGEEGVPGGGFAIFNVSPGLRTITLASRNHSQIYRELMVVDNQYTNIVNLTGIR